MINPTGEKNKKETTRRIIVTVITFTIAAILLFLAFRGVDWNELGQTMQEGDITWLSISFFALGISHFLRALRWRVLLESETSIHPVTVFYATAIGYLGNAFLPARAGELLRTLVIRRTSGLQTVFVLTTALTERVIDAAFLAVVALITISQLSNTPDWLGNAAQIMAVLGFTALFILFLMPHLQGFLEGILNKLPLGIEWKDRIKGILQNLIDAMRLLQDLLRALKFAVLTLMVWSMDVVFTLCIATAFGISLNIPEIILLLAALGLASAAPSTPGYIGIYQFVSVTVLAPFGITQDKALALIIAFQGVIYIFLIFWGIIAIWRTSLYKQATIREEVST